MLEVENKDLRFKVQNLQHGFEPVYVERNSLREENSKLKKVIDDEYYLSEHKMTLNEKNIDSLRSSLTKNTTTHIKDLKYMKERIEDLEAQIVHQNI